MTDFSRAIWEKALELLKLRPHSRKELKDKLTIRFPDNKEALMKVLDELERVELLNDRRFTEMFLQHLIQKPIGWLKIMAETHKRGLDAKPVEAMLLNLEWNEEENAKKAMEEKGALIHEKNPQKRKIKLMNFLRNRGFKNSTIYRLLSFGAMALLLLINIPGTQALISDGAAAVNGLGQMNLDGVTPHYTKGSINNGPNNEGFNAPESAAVDTTNKRLFIADTSNHRILVFNLDMSNNLVDYRADFVLGQSDFFNSIAARGQSSLDNPTGMAYDSAANRLFVADSHNNRVLVFDVATITNGEDAVNVLGQANFTTGTAGTTQSTLSEPRDVLYDSATSRLFVSDQTNNRIMVFDVRTAGSSSTDLCANGTNTTGIANGMNASCVLGQGTFTTSSSGTTQSTLSHPVEIAYANPLLFVVDQWNHRVMAFDVTAIVDGENAVKVLGQATFTTSVFATTQSGMAYPVGVEYDSANQKLFVSQYFNNRVTVYDINVITNGENAVNVLGQSDFISSFIDNTQSTFSSPQGMGFDSVNTRLYVTDLINNRIMAFNVGTLSNGPNASNAVGQLNTANNAPIYTKAERNNGPSSDGFNAPTWMAVDEVNHRLFVSDEQHNRVLVFNLTSTDTLTDYVADNVLGQPDFDTMSSGITQSKFAGPAGLVYDSANNRLFVAERTNHRVMVFDVAVITNGENAVYVLGQPDFATGAPGITQSKMAYSSGLAYDNTNQWLFVAETNNNRVTVYDVVAITNGETAIKVLGQALFTTNSSGITQSKFFSPDDVAYNQSNQRLFVSDSSNHRIMVFNVGDGITDGENAVNVLGQVNFTSNSVGITQSKFWTPTGVAYHNPSNRLFVTDQNNYRVLVFDMATIANGQNAVNVLGQVNFTSSSSGLTQSKFNIPRSLAYNTTQNHLFVSDNSNHRILVFDASSNAAPTVVVNSATEKTDGTGTVDISVTVSDANANNVKLKVMRAAKIGGTCGDDETFSSKATLDQTPANISCSVSPSADVTNANAYQIGTTTPILTSAANTVQFDWNSPTDTSTFEGNYCLQFIPNDSTTDGTAVYQSVTLDNTSPTTPGNLTVNARNLNSLTFGFGAATVDANFQKYQVHYRTGSIPALVCTDSVWTPTNDANLGFFNYNGATSTTITGLLESTAYSANICAYDTFGHFTAAVTGLITSTASPGSSTPSLPNTITSQVELQVNLGPHRDEALVRMVNQLLIGTRMVRDRVTLQELLEKRAGRKEFKHIHDIRGHAAFRATLLQLVTENAEVAALLQGQASGNLILEVWAVGLRKTPLATITVATNLFGETSVTLPALAPGNYDFTIRKPLGLPQALLNMTLKSTMTLNFPDPIRVGDLDGDGKINVSDFRNFMQNLGNTKNDFDEDGKVDLKDIAEFLRSLE